MRGEHLGTFTVTGAFALVLQFHRKEHQRQQQQREIRQKHRQIMFEEEDEEDSEAEDEDDEEENQKQGKRDELDRLVAHIGLTSGGLAKSIELYGEYVCRQIGLRKDSSVAKALAELAMEYLHGDKSQNDHSLDNLVAFLSKRCRNSSEVFTELVQEMDACMISYFSFHWHHSAHLLDQVRSGQRNLRSIVMAATRKHRFQRAMQTLKAKRAFTTLLETLKAMKNKQQQEQHLEEGDRLHESVSNSSRDKKFRNPVLMLVGGGMGAGKSTVVKNLLHESGGASGIVRHDAVVVEADAFKETDVLYKSLSSGSGDVSLASQLVHDSSTRAASSLLVSALNEGRDVVFDGTMSWEPFVVQTIAMARDVHRRRYRLGPGYKQDEKGVVIERYWEPVNDEEARIEEAFLASIDTSSSSSGSSLDSEKVVEEFLAASCSGFQASQGEVTDQGSSDRGTCSQVDQVHQGGNMSFEPTGRSKQEFYGTGTAERPPYRIVLVGVVCDALLAVVRGLRRAIITNRFVPITAQLNSHKMFAANLERYSELVDDARIYSTSKIAGSPELVGIKDAPGKLRKLDIQAFETVSDLALLNPNAASVLELYSGGKSSKVWREVALAPDRGVRQDFLRRMLIEQEEQDDYESTSSCSGLSSPPSPESSVYSLGGSSSTDSLSRLDEYGSKGSLTSLLPAPAECSGSVDLAAVDQADD